ncbi:hypothetical protein F3Y22_tig00110195pilonHSYRG00095 [Hibiscus syriacus]|uniref:Sulfotransferase n=1 Tax=Hibiscus syriacus TaxID=106335 RepID=A0A6A3BD25_HIBSY|nr:hypothetical protein F3Y22_tig00110195pilonHSYRG00095 [Hibiscus syriacus]
MESSVDSKRNQSSNGAYGEDILSNLPVRAGLNLFNDELVKYQGFWFPGIIVEGILRAQRHFQANSSDIFLCTAPKTGTTWMKTLTFAIVLRTTTCNHCNPLLSKSPQDLLRNLITKDPENPLIPTHIPFSYLPKSVSDPSSSWYWKASLDQPDKVLFLKYEEMKEDTAFYVAKLAGFIGYGFTSEEKRDGVVEKIVRMCSFDHLRNLEVNKNGKF